MKQENKNRLNNWGLLVFAVFLMPGLGVVANVYWSYLDDHPTLHLAIQVLLAAAFATGIYFFWKRHAPGGDVPTEKVAIDPSTRNRIRAAATLKWAGFCYPLALGVFAWFVNGVDSLSGLNAVLNKWGPLSMGLSLLLGLVGKWFQEQRKWSDTVFAALLK